MARKIAVFNMKGGVGKTTTACNLAVGLAKFHNQRVLLVDIDPQGNASASLGIDIWKLQRQTKDVLLRQLPIQEVIVRTNAGVDVVPSNILLAEEEIPISGLPGRELLLRKTLAPIEQEYDWIVSDCPPNVGVFTVNALIASSHVIIPVDMSYLGLLGIRGIERALKMVREALDHPIDIAGALATRFDSRNNLSKEVLRSLQEHYGDRLCKTIIPETVKIRESPSHGISIFDYDPGGAGAKAYRSLVDEVKQWP